MGLIHAGSRSYWLPRNLPTLSHLQMKLMQEIRYHASWQILSSVSSLSYQILMDIILYFKGPTPTFPQSYTFISPQLGHPQTAQTWCVHCWTHPPLPQTSSSMFSLSTGVTTMFGHQVKIQKASVLLQVLLPRTSSQPPGAINFSSWNSLESVLSRSESFFLIYCNRQLSSLKLLK